MLFSCFANLFESEEARKQIILVIDGPASGKAEALPQPQHRFETGDGPSRCVEGLEAADFRHVLLHPEMVTLDALLKVFGNIMNGVASST